MGVKFVRLGTVLGAKQEAAAWDAAHASEIEAALKAGQKKPEIAWSAFDDNFARAKSDITPIINEAQARLTKKASLGMGELVRAVWTKRCSDKPCYDKVPTISKLHELEMNAQQKLPPDFSTLQISGEVGRKFSPLYQAEIDASKARVAAAEAGAGGHAAQGGGPAGWAAGLKALPGP